MKAVNEAARRISAEDTFFVGYLRAPRSLVGFLRKLVPLLAVGGLGLAWQVSRSQNDPGDGVWHEDVQTLVGRISATPYPHIRVASDRAGRPIETILLVSQGKHGGDELVSPFEGTIVQVRGTVLERDERRLLELADTDAIKPWKSLATTAIDFHSTANSAPSGSTNAQTADLASAPAERRTLARVSLRGEIIDPKCYSGAMKPGEGKTHKECATLCIAGGIPPMFVTVNETGDHHYFLLVDPKGRALRGRVLHEQILPFVADDVELSGELEIRDDLTMLRLDPTSIRRL